MNIKYETPSEADLRDFEKTLGSSDMLQGRVKIIVEVDGNVGVTFMKIEDFERLGKEYIESHATITYSKFAECWFVGISENDYYNNPQRNPAKVIPVFFDGHDPISGAEVYRSKSTGRYYLRQVSSREQFARWLVCGMRRKEDDGDEPRPNLIFEHNGQMERVRYDDWNGVAAYSDTFNPHFSADNN